MVSTYGFCTTHRPPRLRHFPTYAITYGPIAPAVGAEPSPHRRETVEYTVMGLKWYLGLLHRQGFEP